MDFNDIKSRLDRLHASVNSKIDPDIEKHMEVKTSHGANFTLTTVNFDKAEIAEKENKIMLIIHNLANLKEHLKEMMTKRGEDKQKIEDEIKSNKSLQIAIDLANSEKHTYPSTSNRSGLNPKIGNIQSFLRLTASQPGEVTAFAMRPDGSFQSHGNAGINIEADILDEHNNKLMSLDELISDSLAKWEEIIAKFSLA